MIAPNWVKYELEQNEIELPFDMQMLASEYKREFPDYLDPVQRGHRLGAIHPETKVILHEPLGWCAGIDGLCTLWMTFCGVRCVSQGLRCRPERHSSRYSRLKGMNPDRERDSRAG